MKSTKGQREEREESEESAKLRMSTKNYLEIWNLNESGKGEIPAYARREDMMRSRTPRAVLEMRLSPGALPYPFTRSSREPEKRHRSLFHCVHR